MRRVLLSIFMMLLFSGSLLAQEVTFDAQVRFRSEFQKNMGPFPGDFGSDRAGNFFDLLRTRVGATFTNGGDITAYVQIQDSRFSGEELSTLEGTANRFDLHQGFIIVGNLFDKGLDLKVGRMEFSLGNERLVGTENWNNVGRSFDGQILSKSTDNYEFKFFNFKVNEAAPSLDFDPDTYFNGIWYGYSGLENRELNLFAFFDLNNDRIFDGVDQDKRRLVRFTPGLHYTANWNNVHYSAEAAYQVGNIFNLGRNRRDDITAYMFGGRLKYKWEDNDKQPYIGVGWDYLSGDSNAQDEDAKTFNLLFGETHSYYGYMDYFQDIRTNTQGLGLSDFMVNGGMMFNEKYSLHAAYHYFSAAEEGSTGDTAFGNEVDVTFKYHKSEDLALKIGGSFFLPGEYSDNFGQQNDDAAWWFYGQLSYHFNQN